MFPENGPGKLIIEQRKVEYEEFTDREAAASSIFFVCGKWTMSSMYC